MKKRLYNAPVADYVDVRLQSVVLSQSYPFTGEEDGEGGKVSSGGMTVDEYAGSWEDIWN